MFATSTDRATQQVVKEVACTTSLVRGLTARKPVMVQIVDATTLGKVVKQIMQLDDASRPITSTEVVLQLFGALGPKDNLAAIRDSQYSLTSAAQYAVEQKTLYVRASQGKFTPLDLAIISHEYEEALQDQYIGLAALLGDGTALHNSDARLARQALVEGDALTTMLSYASTAFNKQQTLQFNQQLQRSPNASSDYVHDQISFPAAEGITFVNAIRAAAQQGKQSAAAKRDAGNAAVDQAMRNPPVSTAEVLDPTRYLHRTGNTTQAMPLPGVSIGAQWTLAGSDVLGPFAIEDLLTQNTQQHSPVAQAATQAATTWQADRWAVYQHAGSAVMVWRARFASAADAQSLIRALVGYTAMRFHAALTAEAHLNWHTKNYAMSIGQRDTEVVVAIGSDEGLLTQTQQALSQLGFS